MMRLALTCLSLLLVNLPVQASVVFYVTEQGALFGFERPDLQDPVSAVAALAKPPAAAQAGQALGSGLPAGTQVRGFWMEGDTTVIEFSRALIGSELDEARLSLVFQQVKATLFQFGQAGSVRLQVDGKLLSEYLPPVQPVAPGPASQLITPKAAGALSGRKIALSPGHGYYWTGSGWSTARPVYCSPLNQEDFHNLEEMQYLNTYLAQDGATTKPYRCLDKSYGNHASGKAWWQMGSYLWLQNLGYPCSVYASYTGDCTTGTGGSESNDDIRARPLAADYDGTDIYVSLHSNGYAGNCTGSCPTGTETYYDATSPQPTGGQTLATRVNNAILAAITANADPSWTCHGTCVKNSNGAYGEIRIPNRPSCLVELAYHDTCDRDADANHLRDNFFRSTATWGMYKGICDYFGVTPTWAYYSYEIVSHDIPPSINPGATATVHITLRNRGVLWNDARQFRLGAVGEADPFTPTTRYNVGGEVGPNSTKTFTLSFTAPSTPGAYTTDWRMVREGVTWFGPTLSVTVNVGETGYPASWGPYNLTTSRCVYSPTNGTSALRTGWYTTTAPYGAARCVLQAPEATMATMPDASLVSGSTFTVAFAQSGTYSTTADNPLNLYRVNQPWTSSAVWDAPWSAGGDFSSVGLGSQSVVYPADATVYTFSPGAGYSFPYGVLMKGDNEASITYRKAWYASGPYPTLKVNYTTPTPTIRSWAYLGWYPQGAAADRQLRIDTDQAGGTYGGVPVTEATLAPSVGGTSYGNAYGLQPWRQGASAGDLVDLNSGAFYNAVHENAVTYCSVYVFNSKGANIPGAYLGIGSDDSCKVWWNGAVVGSDVVGRANAADSDFWGPLTINAGWNRLLVKVENGTTGHGVYARFANANRTALTDRTYLSYYTTDSTAPSAPTALAAAGATSGVWQNAVAAPTFTWTSGADTQAAGQGVSGVRGQKFYFGPSPDGVPTVFQAGASFAPGTLADGQYFFKVSTVDYALNESQTAVFAFLRDGTAPTGVSLNLGTVTLDSIAVSAAGVDAHSGINPGTGYNYSRAGAASSGPKGPTHTWTGLEPNTEYTGLSVAVSDQAAPTPNTAVSAARSAWTLSVPPGPASITVDNASAASGSTNWWTAVGGFGPGQVQYYRYAFDQSPTHAWTGAEPQWSGGALATVPAAPGTWYLHVQGCNGAGVANGAFEYALNVSQPLTAANLAAGTQENQPLNIALEKLLALATGPEGHPLSVSAVSPASTNGGSVVLSPQFVTYTPVTNYVGLDRFTYTVSDALGGSASAYVQVVVRSGEVASGNMLPPLPIPGGYQVSFVALPGQAYTVQRAPTLTGPWSTIASVTADETGFGSCADTNSPPVGAFYRTVYP